MSGNKTLYISDLDGTLLGEGAKLSERSVRLLNDAYKNGVSFAAATARTAATVNSLLKQAPPTVPSIMQNGVSIYDIRTQTYIRTHIIDVAAASQIIKKLDETRVKAFIYTAENGMSAYYTELKNAAMRAFVDERVKKYGKKFTHIQDPVSLTDKGITYFSLTDTDAAVLNVIEAIKDVSGINYTYYHDIYDSHSMYLEIFADTASKKHGAEFLKQEYGFNTVVGFGDNLNDLPLFEACDVKIAVENAHESVKASADIVIGKNTDDSVARYIREHI